MIGLIQRVSEASCTIDGELTASIGPGLLVLLGVEAGDGHPQAARLAQRVLAYRVFPDLDGRMNLSVCDIGGELLIVPQFTLAAATHKGNRPGFSSAAPPKIGEFFYDSFVAACRERYARIATGRFGAYMKIALVNDGPVTFWLDVPPDSRYGAGAISV